MVRLPLSLVCLVTSLPAAPQNGHAPAPRSIEAYPVRAIVTRVRPLLPPPLTTFLRSELFRELGDEPVGLEPGTLLDLMRGLRSADIDGGRLDLDLRNDTLWAQGEPGTVLDVGRELEQLAAVLARPIAVEAALYELAEGAPPDPILRPEGVAVLRRASPLWSARAVTRAAVPVALGRMRWTSFVRDLEVEVAEKASIADPQLDAFFEGVRLVVEPHALTATEDLVLLCQFAIGDRRGPVHRRTAIPKVQPSVDAPLVELNTGRMSGRIVDQGALALTIGGVPDGGSRRLLVVSARYTAPRVEAPADLHLYPASALTTGTFLDRPELPRRFSWSQGDPSLFEGEESERVFGSADPEELLEIVRAAAEGLAPVAQLRTLQWAGPFLAALGPAEAFARVEAALQRMQDGWLRNAEITARTRLLGSDEDEASAADLHLLVLPALLGRYHAASRGLETTAIRDYDVEIAAKASTANPIVEARFGGLSLLVRPYAAARGVGADLLVDLTHEHAPQRRPAETPQMGDLDLVSTERARFHHHGAWSAGDAAVLGAGPPVEVGGRIRQTQQEIAITAR